MKTVSVIIVNYNGSAYTRNCLTSLFVHHPKETLDVIVVDNHSSDGSVEMLSTEFPDVRIIALKENKGFGTANNVGAELAECEHLFFVNNDTVFIEEILSGLVNTLNADSTIGIAGPRLLNEDRSFQLSYGPFPTVINEFLTKNSHRLSSHRKESNIDSPSRSVEWLTGAALLMKKSVYRSIGGFDERFFLYFEDIDLNKRIRNKGFKIVYVPSLQMIHLGGKSYGTMNPTIAYEYRRSQLRYYDLHNSILQSILVRFYIAVKYLPKLLSRDYRSIFRIFGLIVRRQ